MKRAFRPAVSPLEGRLALAAVGAAVHAGATKAVAAPAAPAVPLSMATALVDHLYRETLGRNPDGLAVAGVIPAVQAGATPAQLTTQLVSSAEFINNAIAPAASSVANESSYVADLYGTVLGRSAGAAEVNFWVNAIEARTASLGQVAAAIVGSPEAATSSASILVRNSYANIATAAMTELYQDSLGRNPDPVALSTGVAAMTAGTTMAQMTAALVSSAEYVNAHIAATASGAANQASYVAALYETVLGRSPDPAGLAAYTTAINTNAASLAQVAAAIVGSPEAATSSASILVRNAL